VGLGYYHLRRLALRKVKKPVPVESGDEKIIEGVHG